MDHKQEQPTRDNKSDIIIMVASARGTKIKTSI